MADLDPASADDDLVPALARALPRFEFSLALIDDHYWRGTRSVIRPDGTCLGELRPWMTAELIKEGDDVEAPWRRLKETDLQITEWRGTSAFVLAPTGPAAADYIQIALGRESEWQAAPIVNPDYRPLGQEELSNWPTPIASTARPTACWTAPAAPSSISKVFSDAVAASSAIAARPSDPKSSGG